MVNNRCRIDLMKNYTGIWPIEWCKRLFFVRVFFIKSLAF